MFRKSSHGAPSSSSKQWGTVNLRDSYGKVERFDDHLLEGNNTKKNSKTKSIDFELKEKYYFQQPSFEPLEDNVESHNIEVRIED